MKFYTIVAALLFASVISASAQAPKINSFSPTNGQPGTRVTITGSGFSSIADSNAVYFGAVRASVNSAAATQLSVTVPADATYQPINIINKETKLSGQSALPFSSTFYPATTGLDNAVRLPSKIAAADVQLMDIDGDGKTDIIATNPTLHELLIYLNKATVGKLDTGSFASPIVYKTGAQPHIVAIQDLDGDGRPDIVLMNIGFANTANGNNSLTIFNNLSTSGKIKLAPVVIIDSTATTPVSYNFQLKPGDNVARIADLDGDGKPDIVVLNTTGSITVYRNAYIAGLPLKSILGTGTPVSFPVAASPLSFTIGDLDSDGKPDMIVSNFNGSSMTVLRNSSVAGIITASSFQRVDFSLGFQPLTLTLADIDGDGKLDELISRPDNKLTTLIHNTSTPGKASGTGINLSNLPLTSNYNDDLVVQDADGDGKPDLLSLNPTQDSVYLYINKSTPGQITTSYFGNKINFAVKTIPDCVGDLDGDGRPDIVVGSLFGIDIYHSKYAPLQTPPAAKTTEDITMSIFPNPTTLSAQVKYTLPSAANVLISIYTTDGRFVKSFKTGNLTSGDHLNTLETENLKTGVYIITLKANNYNKSGRLVVQ